MENNEKTIDLLNVFNYVICHIKQIVIITLVFMILGLGVGVVKDKKAASVDEETAVTVTEEPIEEEETYYYSTAKILFKCDSVQSVEKKYDVTSGQLQVQEVNERNTNCAFLNNSSLIFSSDTILIKLMDKYDFKGDLSEFKENVKVDRLDGTDVVRVVVRANEPEVAEEMVNLIVKLGIEEADELYQLNYKVIDQYTDYDNSFTDLEIIFGQKEEPTIISSSITKMTVFLGVTGFALSVIYYVLRFVFNDKVEDIIDVENRMKLSVLQPLSVDNKDYALIASKLINIGSKVVLFTDVLENTEVIDDVKLISEELKNKNKKSLIIYVSDNENGISKNGVLNITYNELEETIRDSKKNFDFILVISINANKNEEVILVSKLVEYAVIVIKCNSVKYDKLYRILSDFSKYGKNIDSMVMKDITKESSSYKFVK